MNDKFNINQVYVFDSIDYELLAEEIAKDRKLKLKATILFPPHLEPGTMVNFNGRLIKVIASSPFGDGATIEHEDGKQEWVDCYRFEYNKYAL